MTWSSAALELFGSHAIPPEIAAELGWSEPVPGEMLEYGNGRRRSLNGAEPKVRQPRGQRLAVYWPGERPEAPPPGVLVVEGETDGAAALSALRATPKAAGMDGLVVAAVPGTGFPVTRLAEELEGIGSPPGLLAFDADEAGRSYTARAAAALRGVGVRSVRVELPDGLDVSDYLARADDPGDALASLLADAQAAAEGADYDPEVGSVERLNREVAAQSGNAEFLRLVQFGEQGARWRFTVRSRRTGRPVELDSLRTKQLRNLSNLAERVMEARGGVVPTPRANSEKHGRMMDALEVAAEFVPHDVTEESAWRRRLALHVGYGGELRALDPDDPDGKREAILSPGPFEAPDGRLWVHAGEWMDFLAMRRMDASDADVQAALRQLDFEPRQLSAKVAGGPAAKRYWFSPEGFDWRTEP
jgi:Toprim domain-containing protein